MDPTCTPLPPPRLNGGWFTGEPFRKGAGWADVPVRPESGSMMSDTLLSAHPPPGAEAHTPGFPRPGNNCQTMPNVRKLSAPYNTIACSSSFSSSPDGIAIKRQNDRFAKFMYVDGY